MTNAVAGHTYTVSAYVEAPSSAEVGRPVSIALRVQNPKDSSYPFTTLSTPIALSASWQKVTVSYTMPAMYAGYIVGTYVKQGSPIAGDSFYVDDVVMY